MSEKLCVFCKHFDWERVDYRDYGTSGNMEGGMSCKKRHYSEELPYDNDDFRNLILRAETCHDYKRPK